MTIKEKFKQPSNLSKGQSYFLFALLIVCAFLLLMAFSFHYYKEDNILISNSLENVQTSFLAYTKNNQTAHLYGKRDTEFYSLTKDMSIEALSLEGVGIKTYIISLQDKSENEYKIKIQNKTNEKPKVIINYLIDNVIKEYHY